MTMKNRRFTGRNVYYNSKSYGLFHNLKKQNKKQQHFFNFINPIILLLLLLLLIASYSAILSHFGVQQTEIKVPCLPAENPGLSKVNHHHHHRRHHHHHHRHHQHHYHHNHQQ